MSEDNKGKIVSGALFIGDPFFMADNIDNPLDLQRVLDTNPFYDYNGFMGRLDTSKEIAPIKATDGHFNVDKGLYLSLGNSEGSYTVELIRDENGKPIQILIHLKGL
jgi:hypothetical protein